MASLLLLTACGMPITPAEITATAVADEQAQSNQEAQGSRFGVSAQASNPSAVGLQTSASSSGPNGSASPLSTREAASTTTPESTTEGTEDDATPTPEVAPEATATAVSTPAPTSEPAVVQTNADFASQFVVLLNEQRAGRGLSQLSLNSTITSGATKFATYMASAGFFGHSGPDGSSPSSRLAASGYRGAYKGEALSAGQNSPQGALNALLASSAHAAILLDPTTVEVGVGHASLAGSAYGNYWVVVTGVP